MGRAPALIALLVAACDEAGDATSDAAIADSAAGDPDADYVNFAFTGHYLDWDSTAVAPCPIVGSTWTARYDTSRVAMTGADGAFTISLAPYTPLLDVTSPAGASACTSPQSSYVIAGIAIAPPAVVHAGGEFTARSLTTARSATFYAGFGSAFDGTRANLLVHVNGAQRAISISSAHGQVQAFSGTAWAAGATGVDVFFPNIDLAGSDMTTVTVDGGAIGTGSVPLAAGSITYMTVIVN